MKQKRSIEEVFTLKAFSTVTLERFRRVADAVEAGKSIAEHFEWKESKQHDFYRRLRGLEKALDDKILIVREKGSTKNLLTEAGKLLREIATKHLRSVEAFINGTTDRPVTIAFGGGDTILRSFVVPAIPELYRIAPNVRVSMRELRRRELLDKLETAEIDFALLRSDAGIPGLGKMDLGELCFSVFIHRDARPKRTPSNASIISTLRWAILSGESPISDRLRQVAVETEQCLDVRLYCTSYPQMADAVQTLGLAAPLPKLARAWLSDEVVEMPFPSRKLAGIRYSIFWNPDAFETRPAVGSLRPKIVEAIRTAVHVRK